MTTYSGTALIRETTLTFDGGGNADGSGGISGAGAGRPCQ